MADISAVSSPAPDPKTGKSKTRSEIAFPYFSLDKSIEVPRLIHERAGGRCGRVQLAELLGYSGVKNGGFLTRMSAAKMFGLIDELGDAIVLTERAKKILAPVRPADAEQAKLDAFMSVELYRRVYEDFDGQTLPTPMGLKNLFLNNYKVVPLQVDAALRNLMDSAESAGLFKLAGTRSKMIKPIIGEHAAAMPPAPTAAPAAADNTPRKEHERGGGGAGGGDGGDGMKGVHPALAGLIQNLPSVGTNLGPKRRQALFDAFKSTINFIYPEQEDES
jgi:hypothetical protein